MDTIGFIGLGDEQPHRRSLPRRGPPRLRDQPHRGQGAAADRAWPDLASPREVAAAADVLFSMVTDDAALEAITAGRDGLVAGLRPGAHRTSEPLRLGD